MDSYQKVLGRLSCVPFREFENLPDGSICRAAFVVETVPSQNLQQSQKKFAILIISDGMERFELPVWSEMYEEKGPLLRENQLLYGIVQIERKEGTIQLSCRYLDDLTAVDEARIKACDDVYDRLKAQAKAPEPKWKTAAKEKAAKRKDGNCSKRRNQEAQDPP